jgi:hypothetical protein
MGGGPCCKKMAMMDGMTFNKDGAYSRKSCEPPHKPTKYSRHPVRKGPWPSSILSTTGQTEVRNGSVIGREWAMAATVQSQNTQRAWLD